MPSISFVRHLSTHRSYNAGVFGGAPSAAQGIISASGIAETPVAEGGRLALVCILHSFRAWLQGRLEGLELLFNKNELRTLMRGIPSLSWLIPHPAVSSHLGRIKFPVLLRGVRDRKREGVPNLFVKCWCEDLGILSKEHKLMHYFCAQIYKDQVIIKNTQTYSMYTSGHLDQALSDAGAYQASAAWQQVSLD